MSEPVVHLQWTPFHRLSVVELYALLRLRQEVFVVEQTCVFLDADGEDEHCMHLLAWDGDQLLGYLRVFPPGSRGAAEGVIGRVVVAPIARGKGLARRMMHEAHARVFTSYGDVPIFLSAQSHLAPFYGSLGYLVCGEGYDEDGIPHLPMRRPQSMGEQ